MSRSCKWNGLYLEAFQDGRWKVAPERKPGNPIVTHAQQAKGSNLIEAEQRAQAAAMIIHQLAQ